MKKICFLLLFSITMGFFLTASARQLSPAEALNRVVSSPASVAPMRIKAAPQPIFTVAPKSDSSFNSLYVFQNGASGFLVVSADDCSIPLLGYSDREDFDSENIPPQLKSWLQFYADEIEWAAKHPSLAPRNEDAVANRPARASIEPMIQTRWNQAEPYNLDCPLVNDRRCVTGCVATAMAQIMYYHQWPAKGTGDHSYRWNGQYLSVDFGNTTYDWDAMTLTYDEESTEEAKKAVANLMYSCGVSVNMSYSPSESGASAMAPISALYNNFGYDESMAFAIRYYYGALEWENLIYDQLSQGLPVLYEGLSYVGAHEFLCDGYSEDGYFHFNWGWGGLSDGYFLLSALDPLAQGIGGSGSNSGFNYDQQVVLNLKPAQADSKPTYLFYCYGNFATDASKAVDLGSTVNFVAKNGGFFFFGCSPGIPGCFGVKMVGPSGQVSYIRSSLVEEYHTMSGAPDYPIVIPNDLAEGSYTITPVFFENGNDTPYEVRCPLSGSQALIMTVKDGKATFTDKFFSDLAVKSIEFDTPVFIDEKFECSITFTNPGTEEFYGEYKMYLFNENGINVYAMSSTLSDIDLLPGETKTVKYVSSFPKEYYTRQGKITLEPGKYHAGLVTNFTNLIIYVDPNETEVKNAPGETIVEVTSLKLDPEYTESNPGAINFLGTIECTSGYINGSVTMGIFRQNGLSTSHSTDSSLIYIEEGESSDFTVTIDVSDLDPEEEYYAEIYYKSKAISEQLPFRIPVAGVKGVNAENISLELLGMTLFAKSDAGITSMEVYSVDGLRLKAIENQGESVALQLSDLPRGVYIAIVKDAAGASRSMLFTNN